MQRSKNIALMFLLGAVVVGGTAGFTVDRLMVKNRICAPSVGERNARDLFFNEMAFTKEQRQSWESALEARSKQVDSLFAPVRAQADSIRETYRPLMLQLLTPDQRTKLQQFEQKMNEDIKRRTRDRKPPPEK
jgi:hypothetical protein